MFPIIDPHQHLWDVSLFQLPWLGSVPDLNRSFLLEDYHEATAGLPIVGTVYMEVDVAPDQQAAEAEYVVSLSRSTAPEMLGAIVSGRPASVGWAEHVDRLTTGCPEIKGFRQVLHGSAAPGFCLTDEFVQGIQLLASRNLSFDLCVRQNEIVDAAELARRCPGNQFVLDHCGNPDLYVEDRSIWQLGIEAAAAQPNMFCKISGISAFVRPGDYSPDLLKPFVDHCRDCFGDDRILFAGDWPVCTLGAPLRTWILALDEITSSWSDAARRNLWAETALRAYNLARPQTL